MIQLEQITKSFSTPVGVVNAIDSITLEVPNGQICGVIGRSGAGKSTLVRCVNLLERPTSGRVIVDGQDLSTLSASELRQARHQIGMVFQHFNLLSSRTVYQNVAFQLELLGTRKSDIEQRVLPLLELTGLADKRDMYPSALSGGQKQRVAIARALVTRPKVLLCDEMTSALDPETTQSIIDLVKRINREMGVTILFITHEMDVVKKLADHVAVIDQGRLVEEADVLTLFRAPITEVAQQLVQSNLQDRMPVTLREQIQTTPIDGGQQLIQVAFIGEVATQPMIEAFIQHNDVHVNILQANLEYLRDSTIGTMLIGLSGEHARCLQAVDYLRDQGLDVEELGYVH